jgi:hypothetical protein
LNCSWCGKEITNEFYWKSNAFPNSVIHQDCLNFIWKIALSSKELAEIQQILVKMFQKKEASES